MQEVKISAMDDGTFVVEMESETPQDDMGAAMGGQDPLGMPAEAQGETFAKLDEALDAARMLLGGEQAAGPALMEGEADFIAGFKGANGSQGV